MYMCVYIRGIDLKGSAMGIASMGTICNSRSSVGLSQDGGRSLSGVVTTAAHGLGHIFNMGHDKDYGGNKINYVSLEMSTV